MPHNPEVHRATAVYAGLHANGRVPDPDALADAKRALATAKLADFVARTLADAPPLRQDQTKRIVALLRGAK